MVRPLVLLALSLVVLLTAAGSAVAASAAPGPSPAPLPPPVLVLSKAAIDPAGRDWVAGRTFMESAVFVGYYEGGTWHALPAPPTRYVAAVHPLSLGDVWIVGGARLLHWDGAAWTVTPHPRVRGLDIRDVAAVAPDDVWAVGVRSGRLMRLPGDGVGERTRLHRPVMLHWDGQAWSVVRLPELPGIEQSLDAVAAGGGQVWAVGRAERLTNADEIGSAAAGPEIRYVPVALRWTGGDWRRVRHVNTGDGGTYLVDVDVLADGTAWVAGVVRVTAAEVIDGRERWYTLVERRRGAHWVVRQEKVFKWRGLPRAISATSGRDVWVGWSDDGMPAVQQWNGRGWRLYQVEELGWQPGTVRLGGDPDVAAAPGHVWLVGGMTVLQDWDDTVGDQLLWRRADGAWVKIPFAAPWTAEAGAPEELLAVRQAAARARDDLPALLAILDEPEVARWWRRAEWERVDELGAVTFAIELKAAGAMAGAGGARSRPAGHRRRLHPVLRGDRPRLLLGGRGHLRRHGRPGARGRPGRHAHAHRLAVRRARAPPPDRGPGGRERPRHPRLREARASGAVGVLRRYERVEDGVWRDALLMELLAEDFRRA